MIVLCDRDIFCLVQANMLRNLRTQLFAHLRRGAKRSSESAFSLSTGTTRCCSSHGQPTQLLESEFSLGQSLELQLRSPTSVRIMHGSPYLLHAEWMGSGSEDRFETIQAGQTLSTLPELHAWRDMNRNNPCAQNQC